MISKGKTPAIRPVVVEPGYLGYDSPSEVKAERAIRLAKMLPGWRVVGIDLHKPKQGFTGHKNLKIIKGDFAAGLKELKDNSVTRINPYLSLGSYDAKELFGPKIIAYTSKVLKRAYRKLKKGGKIVIVAGSLAQHVLTEAFKLSRFKEWKIKVIPLACGEKRGTHWTRKFLKETQQGVYRIIAEKD